MGCEEGEECTISFVTNNGFLPSLRVRYFLSYEDTCYIRIKLRVGCHQMGFQVYVKFENLMPSDVLSVLVASSRQ